MTRWARARAHAWATLKKEKGMKNVRINIGFLVLRIVVLSKTYLSRRKGNLRACTTE